MDVSHFGPARTAQLGGARMAAQAAAAVDRVCGLSYVADSLAFAERGDGAFSSESAWPARVWPRDFEAQQNVGGADGGGGGDGGRPALLTLL